MNQPTLTSKDLCRLARVTLRQVQYWSERGLLRPVLCHGRRCFPPRDASRAVAIRVLRKRRFGLAAIRRVLDAAARRQIDPPYYLLMTDGCKLLAVERDAARVFASAVRANGGIWLFEVPACR